MIKTMEKMKKMKDQKDTVRLRVAPVSSKRLPIPAASVKISNRMRLVSGQSSVADATMSFITEVISPAEIGEDQNPLFPWEETMCPAEQEVEEGDPAGVS